MSVLTTYWHAQRRWSNASNDAKAAVSRRRRRVLQASVASTVSGAVAAQLLTLDGGPRVAGIGIAVVAAVSGLATFLVSRRAGRPSTREWTQMRAVSEGLKSEVYRYLAGAPPYSGTAEQRDAMLAQRCDRLLHEAPAVDDLVRDAEAHDKPLPAVHDVPSYLRVRVATQIAYYQGKAPELLRRLRTYRRWELRLSILAAFLGAIMGVVTAVWHDIDFLNAWVTVVASSGAAIATHAAGSHYQQTAQLFVEAAAGLRALRSEWEANPGGTDVVVECERILARETKDWTTVLNAETSADGRPVTASEERHVLG